MSAFAAPAPGDIVWCRFPEMEGIRPGPKARPALVLSVQDDSVPARVRVAYGTSRDTETLAAREFRIGPEDGVAFAVSGLAVATKFSMRKVVVLDCTDLWFSFAPGRPTKPTPQVGVLHPALLERARVAFVAAGGAQSVREPVADVYAAKPGRRCYDPRRLI